MYIEQIYTGCLSEASYYIESGGEAAIIDPMREPQPYLDLAARRGAVIRYVFETHFHADFVSGHLDIARKSGAKIVFGPGAKPSYDFYAGADNEEFELGFVTLRLLHTPGHTPESSCFLLLDERRNPHSVFTGDTLFVGDVGRPDLVVGSGLTREHQAGILFDSIEGKLLSLPNYVIVYPAHGAGSACGKSIGTEKHSTIGVEKETNYALKAKSREEFIKLVIEDLIDPPQYFSMDATINRTGYSVFEDVMTKNYRPLSATHVKKLMVNKNTLIIDTRSPEVFAGGFIRGSINIGLDGTYAAIAGSILDRNAQLILVTDSGRESEAISRLARVGYENVLGFLDRPIDMHIPGELPIDKIVSVTAQEFEEQFRYNSCIAIDVRNPNEWTPGFVAGAKLIPLPQVEKKLNEIDKTKTCFVYCAGGYRSMVAASLLKRNGFSHVVNVEGGMINISKTSISIKQLTSTVN